MSDYSMLICDKCNHDVHSECGGEKSVLTINGEQYTGPCQCGQHSSIKPKVATDLKGQAS